MISPYAFPGMGLLDRRQLVHEMQKDSEAYIIARFRRIVRAIERSTGHGLVDLKSRSRVYPLPFLRAVVSNYIYLKGKVSFMQVADLINKDHTSIIYYVNTLYPAMMKNEKYKVLRDDISHYL